MTSSSLTVPTSVAAGAAVECSRYRDLTIEVSGTFVATVQIQGSVTGTTWDNIGTAQTAPGFVYASEKTYCFLRANVTAYTSGTPRATFAGHDER